MSSQTPHSNSPPHTVPPTSPGEARAAVGDSEKRRLWDREQLYGWKGSSLLLGILSILLLGFAIWPWIEPRGGLFLLAGLTAFAFFIALLLINIPKSQIAQRLDDLNAGPQFHHENAARTTLAQIVGGMFLLLGLAFTWLQISSLVEQQRIAQGQLDTAVRGEVTERFTASIDDFGSSTPEVRLGGLMGLGRIARDSAEDREMVTNILSSYLSQSRPFELDAADSIIRTRQPADFIQEVVTIIGTVWGDSQECSAALSGGENVSSTEEVTALRREMAMSRIVFRNVDLRRAEFRDACLNEALFIHTNLDGSIFSDVSLQGAKFSDSTLRNAIFYNVDLAEVDFGNFDSLVGAQFYDVKNLPDAVKQSGVLVVDVRSESLHGISEDCKEKSGAPSFVHVTYYESNLPDAEYFPEAELLLGGDAAVTGGRLLETKTVTGWRHAGLTKEAAVRCVAEHIVRRVTQHANTIGLIDPCEVTKYAAPSDFGEIVTDGCVVPLATPPVPRASEHFHEPSYMSAAARWPGLAQRVAYGTQPPIS